MNRMLSGAFAAALALSVASATPAAGQQYESVAPAGAVPQGVVVVGPTETIIQEAPCDQCAAHKVCVQEPKKRTKTVYCCKGVEYCVPRPSLRFLFGDKCAGPCCQLRTRTVLIKKKAPLCDTIHCVVKDASVGECTTCAAPAGVFVVPEPKRGALHY